jgi:hypothetical protein
MSPTWLEVALLAWVHCQLGMLALEAVATETQADGLLNSSIICGFSVILGEQASSVAGGVGGYPLPGPSASLGRSVGKCQRGGRVGFGRNVLNSTGLLPKELWGVWGGGWWG